MDHLLNYEQVTMSRDQQLRPKEIAQDVVENSGGPTDLAVPSSVTWSEGISPCKAGSWVGY
jgi:hypothetical protein